MRGTRNQGIRAKISNLILIITIAIFIITISVISIANRKASLNDAFTLTDTYSQQYANEVKAYLDEYMDVARAISTIFEGKDNYPLSTRRQIFMNMLKDVLVNNPHFLAVWTIWEPNAVDERDSLHILKTGSTHIGSFSTTYYRDEGQIKLEDLGTEGPLFVGSYYTIPKATKKETVLNPIYYSYTGNEKDEIHQTSMIIPIVSNQSFYGVIGVDATLESFKELINKIKPFNDGYAFLMANDGSFVAHPAEENIGTYFSEIASDIDKEYEVVKKIKKGEPFSLKLDKESGKIYYSFTPIYIGNSTTPWSLAVAVPYKSILKSVNRDIIISSIIGLLGIIILAITINFISKKISQPLMGISDEMEKLNAANVDKLDSIAQDEQNEIGNIATASHTLIDWINKTGEFAKNIGNGNYEYEYELFNKNDFLGKSLLEMRDTLKQAQSDTKERELENNKRTWSAQGLALMNDTIRKNNDDIESLYYHIISNLVQYIEANQGGLFLIEHDDEDKKDVLNLKSSFAYNRRKFLKRKSEINEGLLGECIKGKEKILLSEIPDDYIEISSGMGGANPRYILISPLIYNEKVYGVIEIASFNKIGPHVCEFVESVSETIASTISMIKTNFQTTDLLEKSQSQAEELETSERELQQNLEELKAVHEQMDLNNKKVEEREKNVIAILDGIQDGILACDTEGVVLDVNPEFRKFTGYSKNIEGDSVFRVLEIKNMNDLKINKEQTFNLIKSDDSKVKVKAKVSQINKVDGINYMFLIRT
jgi:methyl-accepting chemotaxis protein